MSELPLCKCGCGTQVERKSKKYFQDHFRNPPIGINAESVPKVKVEPVVEKKPVVKAKKAKAPKQNELAAKIIKAKTKPVPGGKISRSNLQGVGLAIYTC